ncbi:putative colanic acid biosynthesis acetyltransferase [Phocaeicola sp.]
MNSNIGKVSFSNKIRRMFWNLFYYFFFRPFGTRFFRLWRIYILRLWGAQVANSSSVYASTKIWAPWNLILEEDAGIGPNVIVYNQDIVHLCRHVKVSQYCYLCTAGHNISILNNAETGLLIAPIYIKEFAWIAADAFIGMGVTIGEGAVVGARAAVFRNVEPWTVVGGNPAKYIKKRVLKDE